MVGAASSFQHSGSAHGLPGAPGNGSIAGGRPPRAALASKKNCGTIEELKLQEERAKAAVQQSQRQGQ
jgi:hypothetical protein